MRINILHASRACCAMSRAEACVERAGVHATICTMEIVARCPKCDAGLPVPAADAPGAIKCGRCGRDIPLTFTEALRSDAAVDRCPVCGGADFYMRKDFDPKIGLTVVIIGALISAAFYWFGRDLIAYGILA